MGLAAPRSPGGPWVPYRSECRNRDEAVRPACAGRLRSFCLDAEVSLSPGARLRRLNVISNSEAAEAPCSPVRVSISTQR